MPLSEEEITRLSQDLETTRSELASTKKALDITNSQLKERDAAFKPLENELTAAKAQVTELSGQITVLNENVVTKAKEIAAANEALGTAVASFKAAVITAHPEIPEELITGDTIPDITQSMAKAQTIVGKVNASLQDKIKKSTIPAGAPPRGEPDLSSLSPREKIRYGISQGK